MFRTARIARMAGIGASLALVTLAQAGELRLSRNQLIPIRFSESIHLREVRVGDRIRAEVEPGRQWPRGIVLFGEIRSVRPSIDGQPGRVDLSFVTAQLPDGTRLPISASPLARNARDTRQAGRIIGQGQGKRKENIVLGGAIGGLILGSAVRRPGEGLVLGTLGSILAAEADRGPNLDLVVKRGDRYNAIVDRDMELTWRDDRSVNEGEDRTDSGRDRQNTDRPEKAQIVTVEVGGRTLRLPNETPAIREDDAILVPLEATAKQLGFNAFRTDRFWFIEDENHMARLEPESRESRIDGKRISLNRETVERYGVMYVTLQVFLAISNQKISVDGNIQGPPTY